MSRRPKFRPRITRIELNPEQAVLQCDCVNTGRKPDMTQPVSNTTCFVGPTGKGGAWVAYRAGAISS